MHPGAGMAATPVATATYEMTGGLRYTYRGAWCSEGRPTSLGERKWAAVGPPWYGDVETATTTSRLMSWCQPRASCPRRGASKGRSIRTSLPASPARCATSYTPWRRENTGRWVRLGHEQFERAVAMASRAIESARSGRKVQVNALTAWETAECEPHACNRALLPISKRDGEDVKDRAPRSTGDRGTTARQLSPCRTPWHVSNTLHVAQPKRTRVGFHIEIKALFRSTHT